MFDYKHAVIYQIWPRSFLDTNHDGIGDIPGIIKKLPYLKKLSIDAIWLSPVYASPNDDYGYDISDYYSINPEYGTMEDMEQLISEAGKLGISIIMDLVANHTSTSHIWFQNALNDPSSRYRSYYIFRKGKDGNPPNNWMSFFAGSAWQKAEDDMYYLTLYTKTQADLDWTNPMVREEIAKITDFWLEKGIAGFRMDTINTIDKAPGYPSKNPEKPGLQFPDDLVIDGPHVKEYLEELAERSFCKYDAFSLGEGVLASRKCIQDLSSNGRPVSMMFHFDLASLGYGELGKYDCRRLYIVTNKMFKDVTRKWQTAMMTDCTWIGNYLSNHDQKRHLSRFGNDRKYRKESAKMLALYNFTLIGTPFIYQGEEFAMTNPKLKKKDWRDYEVFSSSKAMRDILHIPAFIADAISSFVDRDNARTPVQWTDGRNAGFTDGTPWIMINPDYVKWNARSQESIPDSALHFYRSISRIRHEHECLCTGSWRELCKSHLHVLAYVRESATEKAVIVLNLSSWKQKVRFEKRELISGPSVISSYKPRIMEEKMSLLPYEAHLWILRKQ